MSWVTSLGGFLECRNGAQRIAEEGRIWPSLSDMCHIRSTAATRYATQGPSRVSGNNFGEILSSLGDRFPQNGFKTAPGITLEGPCVGAQRRTAADPCVAEPDVVGKELRGRSARPLTSELGTYKTVKAIFLPFLSGKSPETLSKLSLCWWVS